MSDAALCERFAQAWRDAGGQADAALAAALVAAWREPQRHYHTLQHLQECLAHLDAARALADDAALVELALWFHDAVYDPRAADNEERSAAWAGDAMRGGGIDPASAARVQALVRATCGHVADTDDADTALLLDIDLAILGAAPARFDEFERQIRAEYAHVPLPDYRAGRARVLRGFLQRPRLYLTGHFARLDAPTRDNLARALRALEAA